MSARQRLTTTILNFTGLFFVATLLDKMNSALCFKLSTKCFTGTYIWEKTKPLGGEVIIIDQKKDQILLGLKSRTRQKRGKQDDDRNPHISSLLHIRSDQRDFFITLVFLPLEITAQSIFYS